MVELQNNFAVLVKIFSKFERIKKKFRNKFENVLFGKLFHN